MRIVIFALVLLLSTSAPLHAQCKKEDICAMIGKMGHFEILDKCPGAGPHLVECKKVSEKTVEDLPKPNFVDNGNGTVTDTVNKLLWIKKGILKKVSLKEAKDFASMANNGGKSGWRLPTLVELKTLIHNARIENISGKKAWINPIFDDGRGHYYWTTTTCDEVSVIEDRYQKKVCQEGDKAAWLVHFNINAVFWHHVTAKNYHIWLVQNLK